MSPARTMAVTVVFNVVVVIIPRSFEAEATPEEVVANVADAANADVATPKAR